MKKLLIAMTVIALVFSMTTCFAADAENGIRVTVENKEISFDQGPVLVGEKPMVPMRAVFEAAGAYVAWDNDTETATAIKDSTVVMIQIGNEKLFKGSEAIVLETPAMLLNDRTLIPLEAVAKALDCDVQWNSETKEIVITYKAVTSDSEDKSSEANAEKTEEVSAENSGEEVKETTEEASAENSGEAAEETTEEASAENSGEAAEETTEE